MTTDPLGSKDLEEAEKFEKDDKPLLEWLDVLIIICVAAIVIGFYFWTRK